MNEVPAPTADDYTLDRKQTAKAYRVSLPQLHKLMKLGQVPEPSFYLGNRPRWLRTLIEADLEKRVSERKALHPAHAEVTA